ncbi:hypothetical protein ABPG74_000605 [Tetrahymena malaccensis]
MTDHKKLDSIEIQQQLKNKLEDLFRRENLEKDVYFIARMNDKLEIPLQIVYQQKEIYRICPNGRYVLQALKTCENIIVNQEFLYVIPKIIPNKVRIYIRIAEIKHTSIENLLNHIKDKSNIKIDHIKNTSSNSAFLTVENEEKATALYNWIIANKIENEPAEIQLREENLFKVFRNNVKEDLSKYYEKLKEDKKAQEMYENLQFFQGQNNFPVANKNKVGENIFANPFNYFFYQQPTQDFNLQPSIRKSNGESAAIDKQQQQQQFNPLAFMMFQQPQLFGLPQQGNPNNISNNHRRNNHVQGNGKTNNNNSKGNNRSKSRGQVDNNNKNSSLNKSKSKKRQDGGKYSEKKGKNASNYNNKSGEKVVNKDKNSKKGNLKTGNKKPKPQKPIVDNEENFPSLLASQPQAQNENQIDNNQSENSRRTRKSSAEKRQNAEASPAVKKEVKIKVDEENKDKRDRLVSESRDKARERQVSESRDKYGHSNKNHEKSGHKFEEVVYVRKGKDVKITYEKNDLVEIFKLLKEKITPPKSIIDSSKDTFIPVININAAKEIEVTKPTEVELLPLSNPGTPYQGTTSIPYRKSSISRSNIKRKESEQIKEVDETKAQ